MRKKIFIIIVLLGTIPLYLNINIYNTREQNIKNYTIITALKHKDNLDNVSVLTYLLDIYINLSTEYKQNKYLKQTVLTPNNHTSNLTYIQSLEKGIDKLLDTLQPDIIKEIKNGNIDIQKKIGIYNILRSTT